MMYTFETKSQEIKFEMIFIEHFEDDFKSGNPYNTVIGFKVKSYEFSGQSQWTVDIDEFKKFICQLKKMYDELKGEVYFEDKEYGSNLKISCDKGGQISFLGKFIDDISQKLEFKFTLDQTFLRDFVERTYKDFLLKK